VGDPLFRTDRSVPPMPAQMRRLRDSYDEAIAAGVPESRLSVIGAEDALSKIRVKNAQGALVERGGNPPIMGLFETRITRPYGTGSVS
jgi:hypothetical protein